MSQTKTLILQVEIDEMIEFEQCILDANKNGIKVDKSKIVRAFIESFNKEPQKELKRLKFK